MRGGILGSGMTKPAGSPSFPSSRARLFFGSAREAASILSIFRASQRGPRRPWFFPLPLFPFIFFNIFVEQATPRGVLFPLFRGPGRGGRRGAPVPGPPRAGGLPRAGRRGRRGRLGGGVVPGRGGAGADALRAQRPGEIRVGQGEEGEGRGEILFFFSEWCGCGGGEGGVGRWEGGGEEVVGGREGDDRWSFREKKARRRWLK